jgi:hypothetical protein
MLKVGGDILNMEIKKAHDSVAARLWTDTESR